MPTPDRPRIYHIVHVDNLASIVGDGCLWPDAVMVKRQGAAVIGNNEIKADRLVLPVQCNPGTCVGDYVPFYLCPRSVMLYVISRRNHPNVAYKGGVEGLKQIAVQKWIALFTDGGNAWAEWRRTCQPNTIQPGPAAVVQFIPRRFFYSTTELSANSENVQAAIARQGPDNFGTRVYWDTKPEAAPTCQ